MIFLDYSTEDVTEEVAFTVERIKKQYNENYKYLDSIKEYLPSETLAFATSSWHYNPSNHQCPHDSWVESLNINEVSYGERQENRRIDIHLRLLGAYIEFRQGERWIIECKNIIYEWKPFN